MSTSGVTFDAAIEHAIGRENARLNALHQPLLKDRSEGLLFIMTKLTDSNWLKMQLKTYRDVYQLEAFKHVVEKEISQQNLTRVPERGHIARISDLPTFDAAIEHAIGRENARLNALHQPLLKDRSEGLLFIMTKLTDSNWLKMQLKTYRDVYQLEAFKHVVEKEISQQNLTRVPERGHIARISDLPTFDAAIEHAIGRENARLNALHQPLLKDRSEGLLFIMTKLTDSNWLKMQLKTYRDVYQLEAFKHVVEKEISQQNLTRVPERGHIARISDLPTFDAAIEHAIGRENARLNALHQPLLKDRSEGLLFIMTKLTDSNWLKMQLKTYRDVYQLEAFKHVVEKEISQQNLTRVPERGHIARISDLPTFDAAIEHAIGRENARLNALHQPLLKDRSEGLLFIMTKLTDSNWLKMQLKTYRDVYQLEAFKHVVETEIKHARHPHSKESSDATGSQATIRR